MLWIVLIVIIGTIFFLNYLYNSFAYGNEIYLLSYNISNIELVLYFYIFFVISILLMLKKNRNLFVEKERVFKPLFFHFILTVSLLTIGEYTFSILVQFIFLPMLFKGSLFLKYIYIFCINYALLLAFASSTFILYFLLLAIVTLFVYKEDIVLEKEKYIIFMIIGISLLFLDIFFSDLIYEVYVWLDVVDSVNTLNYEVVFALNLMHLFLIMYIIVKKRNILNFKKY